METAARYGQVKKISLFFFSWLFITLSCSEDMLVNAAKKLSTTHQNVTGDILEIVFDEDSKEKALFKALAKEEDINMHQSSNLLKSTTPLIELSQMLEMKKFKMLQNG